MTEAVFHHFIEKGYFFEDFLVKDEKMQIVRVQKGGDRNFCCILYDKKLLPENFVTVMFGDDVEKVPALNPVQHLGQVLEIKEGIRTIGVLYRYVEPPGRDLVHLRESCENNLISEEMARTLFRSIAIGMLGLHIQFHAHRNLNLSNLAYTKSAANVVTGHIIGYSLRPEWETFFDSDNLYEYMIPIEDETGPMNHFKRDVWMLGAVMMITTRGFDCYMQFRNNNIKKPGNMAIIDVYYKDRLQDLMKRLLDYYPERRCTMEEAVDDPWWHPFWQGVAKGPALDSHVTVPYGRHIQLELVQSGIDVVSQIGAGAYGQVFKVVLSGNLLQKFPEHRIAAMKVADLNISLGYKHVASRREVDVIQNVHHKNIIRMIRMFDTSDFLIIVMELAKGSLKDEIIKNVADEVQAAEVERKFRPWIRGACEGLQYLHQSGYAHRDLKPDNILITINNVAALCDFGLSRMVEENELSSTFVGTMTYAAPQITRKIKYRPRSADCWSMGAIIYRCLSGRPLIPNKNNFERHYHMRTTKVENSVMSPEAKVLVYHLLCMEEVDRWSMDVALRDSKFFLKDTESADGVPPVAGPSSRVERVMVDVEPSPLGRPVGGSDGYITDLVFEPNDSYDRLDPPRTPPMQRSSIFYKETAQEEPKERKYDTFRRY